jgi:hypothetical protein
MTSDEIMAFVSGLSYQDKERILHNVIYDIFVNELPGEDLRDSLRQEMKNEDFFEEYDDVGLLECSYEFKSLEECRESDSHLLSVDGDGYCNHCGFQETSEDEFN